MIAADHKPPFLGDILDSLAGQTVYLSGAITSDPHFKTKFDSWERAVLSGGARCFNPAVFPPGWEYEHYMDHCFILVKRCDIILMLHCWINSPGANRERNYALSLNKKIVHIE